MPIKRIFGKTPAMIAFFEERYGHPTSHATTKWFHDFIFGGMENGLHHADRPLTDERAAIDWDAEDLIAHEPPTSGSATPTCQDWSQGYLNEAWATHSEIL